MYYQKIYIYVARNKNSRWIWTCFQWI